MEKFNLDQLKQNACRTLALIDLIERSKTKARNIWGSYYFALFENTAERSKAIEKQNAVTNRLVSYLEKTLTN